MRAVSPHLCAALLTLLFAFAVSRTGAVTSGVQFVAPLIVIMLVHLALIAWRGLEPGFADDVLKQTAVTAVILVLVFFAAQVLAPMPSEAAVGDSFTMVLFCVFILILAVGAIAAILRGLFLLGRAMWRRARKDDDHLNDWGVLIFVVAVLAVGSLEGIAYRFSAAGEARAVRLVDAPPEAVWAAMENATSPSVALPTLLQAFPQPVAVPVDEGVGLGANRIVTLAGREGRGDLHLRAVHRTAQVVRFETLSHSSPMSAWIGIKSLTYKVLPAAQGTRLEVQLEYQRLLAPAWFFEPLMKGAAALAMGVLATDTVGRAAP